MLIVETRHGPVPVWATLRDPDATSIVVIRGAMAELDQLVSLQRHPTASVVLLHLPGMYTPFFAENSVETFAQAFDQVIGRLGLRRALVIGLSIGGAVALAMQHQAVRRLLLLDTPLTTDDLWPLEEAFATPSQRIPAAGRWFHDMLGYSPAGWERRDYTPLLERLDKPTTVLLGGVPLQPRRPLDRQPSLVCEADRARYRRHPMVEVRVVPAAGHNVAGDGTADFHAAMRSAFEEIDRQPVAAPGRGGAAPAP